MFTYISDLLYFFLLKTYGTDLSIHPIMDQLVESRLLIEKLKPVDERLRYQVNRLVSLATRAPQELAIDEASVHRPRLELLGETPGSVPDVCVEEEGGKASKKDKASDVYKAPKVMAMEYTHDHISQAEKAAQKLDRQRKRLQKSEMVTALRAEISEAPAELGGYDDMVTTGGGGEGKYGEATAERKRRYREQYEDQNMQRMSKTAAAKHGLAVRTKRDRGGGSFREGLALSDLLQVAENATGGKRHKGKGASGVSDRKLGAYLSAVDNATRAGAAVQGAEAEMNKLWKTSSSDRTPRSCGKGRTRK
eukprot:GHVN01087261.1.p1 GENE.GHVN01087261.1~~GHVN01087261.1.p1  ORF type:complete len:307 (+),score=48.35 GHVN01087261.1:368-1288(+)